MKKFKFLSFLCIFEVFTLLVSPFYTNPQAADRRLEIKRKVEEMTSDEKEFTTGEVITKFKEGTEQKTIDSLVQSSGGTGSFPLSRFPNQKGINDYYIVFLNNNITLNANSKKDVFDAVKNESKIATLRETLFNFASNPNVEYVQPNYLYKTTAWTRPDTGDSPSDFDATPSYATGDNWYYEKEKTRQMWQDQDCYNGGSNCGGSSSVIVAVIDTGLAFEDHTAQYNYADDTHDFDVASEYDTSGNNFNIYTNSGEIENNQIDDDYGDFYWSIIDDYHGYNATADYFCEYYYYYELEECTTAEWAEAGHPNDDYGHGTFVTGGIASNVDNSPSSVSPSFNVTIMPLKVNYPWSGSIGTITSVWAIEYAVYYGADVINMSYGGGSYDQIEKDYLDWAYSSGVTLVAASGNDNSSVSYPARFSSVIAVGASDSSDNRADYSNYGSELDLVAAVGDGGAGNVAYQQTYSCFYLDQCGYIPSTDYKSFTFATAYPYNVGTSYASPQVAAAAALIKSRMPDLSPVNVKEILTSTATDIESTGWDQYTGYGLLNLEGIWNRDYFNSPNGWYDSSLGNWNMGVSKYFLVGDYNNDGISDIATIYEYANNRMKMFVFKSNGTNSFSLEGWYDSGVGSWNMGVSKYFLVGDYNNDDISDIATTYEYANSRMKIFVFKSAL